MALSKAAGFALSLILICIVNPASAQKRHALIIGGLGGSPEQTSRIALHLEGAYNALTGPLGFPREYVAVLAEQSLSANDYVLGESTAENIRAQFSDFRDRLAQGDELYILLFGHGSYDGKESALNIPRRDLTGSDYAALSDELIIGRTIWICTMSSSGPFIQTLRDPDRIVITATRTGTQRNQTVFPEYLIESLIEPAADLDRDGSLSVLEVFQYTAGQTSRHYEREGRLTTEHSLLDDNGDGVGTLANALDESGDGFIAGNTWLRRSQALLGNSTFANERSVLERQIATLEARKSELDTDIYYAELEMLFVALARLNERIESELESDDY
ncbi:MAG: ABC transporter C-terminal domain-containing protein [Bacteroidetes bacterium]|nr:ABC transporter C-terminal domain-containing protein [Bacteroidota bacterium]MCY4204255.1 ABC transporter C-terminal domain-containing protein [Bacteroidota bacterium]